MDGRGTLALPMYPLSPGFNWFLEPFFFLFGMSLSNDSSLLEIKSSLCESTGGANSALKLLRKLTRFYQSTSTVDALLQASAPDHDFHVLLE